eukprot:488495-Ditylum_brightwellii.AAC.1
MPSRTCNNPSASGGGRGVQGSSSSTSGRGRGGRDTSTPRRTRRSSQQATSSLSSTVVSPHRPDQVPPKTLPPISPSTRSTTAPLSASVSSVSSGLNPPPSGDNDDASSQATPPVQNHPTGNVERLRTAYFTLKIEMPDSPKPLDALFAKCELIFTTMKETEGTIVLCAYCLKNFKNAITHADQIPSTLASLC